MSSVWKHPRSPFWTGIYRDEAGRWPRYITKARTREFAKRLVQALEDLCRRTWTVAAEYDAECARILKRFFPAVVLGFDEQQAKRALEKEFEKIRKRFFPANSINSVAEFFLAWLRGKELARSEGTFARYRTTMERFLKFLGPRREQPMASIGSRDCQSFHDLLLTDRLSPASVIAEIKTLRGVFNAARRQQLVTFNPAEAVELPARIQQVKRKTFSAEQVEIILREAGESAWQTVTLLGYYGGLRLGDAARLRWENVDLAGRKLVFRMKKTGEELLVPLHPRLEQHLCDLAGDSNGFICPGLAPFSVSGKKGLSQQFLALLRRAGISQESKFTGGKRQLATLSFHSLRKTFNSELAAGGVSQEVRKKLTGHKSDAMNDRYTETRIATLREAVRKLPKLHKLDGKQLELGMQ